MQPPPPGTQQPWGMGKLRHGDSALRSCGGPGHKPGHGPAVQKKGVWALLRGLEGPAPQLCGCRRQKKKKTHPMPGFTAPSPPLLNSPYGEILKTTSVLSRLLVPEWGCHRGLGAVNFFPASFVFLSGRKATSFPTFALLLPHKPTWANPDHLASARCFKLLI